MRKYFVLIGILLLGGIYGGNALETKFIDYNFNTNGFKCFDILDDKIAILSVNYDYPGFFFKPDIIVMENGEWQRLPNYEGSDTSNILLPSTNSQIHYDSTGNIWICGAKLYKYDGSQWTGYTIEGDSNNDKRRFEQLCVDKYNNIWVTAALRFSSSEEYNEFYKFDGENFSTVMNNEPALRFTGYNVSFRSYILSAMPDGRVALHGIIMANDEEYENGQFKDVYIFNQDKTCQRLKLPTASGSDFDASVKAVSSIVPEQDGKMWFALGVYNGELSINKNKCCSGLTLYNDGEWTVFNGDNGLDTLSKGLYDPIYRIVKLSGSGYFLIGLNMYYIMDSDFKLKKYYWEDFFNKSEFIICNSTFNGEKGYEFLGNFLYHPPIPASFIKISSVFIKNNKIYIGMEKGIMVAQESNILSAPDYEAPATVTTIHPNPAGDHIFIRTNRDYTTYRITNSLGQIVLSGNYTYGTIPVSGLAAGVYFIKLYGQNQDFNYSRFIKD